MKVEKPEHKTIEASFLDMKEQVIPEDTPKEQVENFRRCFYSGAGAAYRAMLVAVATYDKGIVEELGEEMEAFYTEISSTEQ